MKKLERIIKFLKEYKKRYDEEMEAWNKFDKFADKLNIKHKKPIVFYGGIIQDSIFLNTEEREKLHKLRENYDDTHDEQEGFAKEVLDEIIELWDDLSKDNKN